MGGMPIRKMDDVIEEIETINDVYHEILDQLGERLEPHVDSSSTA
jgi:flagellar motor switch protein FliG